MANFQSCGKLILNNIIVHHTWNHHGVLLRGKDRRAEDNVDRVGINFQSLNCHYWSRCVLWSHCYFFWCSNWMGKTASKRKLNGCFCFQTWNFGQVESSDSPVDSEVWHFASCLFFSIVTTHNFLFRSVEKIQPLLHCVHFQPLPFPTGHIKTFATISVTLIATIITSSHQWIATKFGVSLITTCKPVWL